MTNEQRVKVDAAHESLHKFFEKMGPESLEQEDKTIGRVLAGAALHLLGDHECGVGYVIAAIAEHMNNEAFGPTLTNGGAYERVN
jgi:hypothetical protein